MSKPYVRKVRSDDPDWVIALSNAGLSWLVFRHGDERIGRAFASFRNAVHWAVEDKRRWT